MPKRSNRFVIEEAECEGDDGNDEEDSDDDSEGSLVDFIDDEAEEFEETEDEELKTPTTRSSNLLLKGAKGNASVGGGGQLKKKAQQKKPAKSKPPPAKKAKKGSVEPEKLPGDSTYPLNSWSLTITKTGGDIAPELLDILASFLNGHCTKG